MRSFLRFVAPSALAMMLFQPAEAHHCEEAWNLLKLKQADSARAVIDKETATEPGDCSAMSWYVRGMVYKTLYDSEGSEEKYRGENVEVKAFEAYRTAIQLDKNQKLTEGILEDILALTEDFTQAGLSLFETGYETRDAATLFKASVYLDFVAESFSLLGPRQVGIHKQFEDFGINRNTFDVCRALAKGGSNQKDEAAAIYEHLVKEKVQNPSIYLNLKDYYLEKGKKAKALETLQIGRQMAPHSLEVTCSYAEVLADTGKHTQSLALLKSLMKLHPDEAEPFASAGFVEERKGNYQQAEAWYHKALDVEPSAFVPNFRMGKLFYKRAEEAKRNRSMEAAQIRNLQETSLQFAESAYYADMHHPGNTRILLELYNALGMAQKAAQIKSVAGQGS